jgi:predicted MFS family arabinose efflux permease
MLCLLVNNYVQLVLARIAAAFGESGGMPPTYSLAGDYFPEPAARARALAIYNLATPLAALLSYVGGGWLNARYGWRMTFFIMGVPGLLLALIVRMTIKDLRHTTPGAARPPPPLAEVLRTLWQQRSTRHLSIALILLYTLGAGVSPWYAAFLIRSHSMTTAEVGVWLGLVFGVIGAAGVLLGGYVAGHWLAEDERGQMRLTALTTASLVPCFALFLLLPSTRGAIFAMVPLVIVFNFFFGPTFALMQRLVVDEMRATTVAIVMLLVNLIGMGIGPQIIGVLSDLLRPALGDNSLRYAILIESLVAFWSAFHFWRVGKTVKEDLELAARIQVKPSPRIMADLHEAEWKAITSK